MALLGLSLSVDSAQLHVSDMHVVDTQATDAVHTSTMYLSRGLTVSFQLLLSPHPLVTS